MNTLDIIFLDFDDVLNTARTLERGQLFESANVEALNVILDRTDTRIVVTSNWRMGATLEELEEILVRAGVHAAGRVVGTTPWLMGCPRGEEISAWLKNPPAPVRCYVILDNRTDMGMCSGHLVQTDPERGLVPDQVGDVLGRLDEGLA